MPDPDTLADMQAAAARIADAVDARRDGRDFRRLRRRWRDLGGDCSRAFCAMCGLDPLIHIPDRIFEGYGPNVEAIRALAERGATLLVTVDCGTTSHEPLAEAQAARPRRGRDRSSSRRRAAAGGARGGQSQPARRSLAARPSRRGRARVHDAGRGQPRAARRGFWTRQRPEPDLLGLLDLVALGTVADVVPLTGLNRAFVAKGLLAMRRRENLGLTALMDVARLDGPPEPWHLGFLLGPAHQCRRPHRPRRRSARSAAAGRSDRSRADRRRTRPAQSRAPGDRARDAGAGRSRGDGGARPRGEGRGGGHRRRGLAPGRGRPCRRAAEGALRPAGIRHRARAGGIGTGSGRSIAGVDLGRAVRQAVEEGLLVKGGGHAMAAGVTLRKDALAAFRAYLEDDARRRGRDGAPRRCAR